MTGPAPGGLYNARRSRTRGPASRDKAPGERRDTLSGVLAGSGARHRPVQVHQHSPAARGFLFQPLPRIHQQHCGGPPRLTRPAPGIAASPHTVHPPKSNRAEKWGFSNSRGQLCSWAGAHVPRGGIARAAHCFASAPPNWSVPTRGGFRCRRGSSGSTQGSTAVGPASPDNPSPPGGW
jgi:hypothetical protein